MSMAMLALAVVAPTVKIVETSSGPKLMRGGEPYSIKGAAGETSPAFMARLAKAGGNSTRTWGSDGAAKVLDEAEKNGLTVTVGMWLGHKRHGFNWDDPIVLEGQREMVRKTIRDHRHRPGVLMWALGNEMESDGNDTPELWKEIELLAKIVKAEDPTRPVLTVTADMNKERAARIMQHAPSLDLIGLNSYGGLPSLATRLTEFGWKKPYIVTEFGPIGPWESQKTPWGAAYEQTSTEKARRYENAYEMMAKDPRCLGSYAFTWGNKQEHTSTWFGMQLATGEDTESVDVATKAWTGKWPSNRSPKIESFKGPERDVVAGSLIAFETLASDPDGDKLTYEYEVVLESTDKRSGGDAEAAPDRLHRQQAAARAGLNAPKAPGTHFRVFVTVRDGKGHAATANLPFQTH